MKHLLSVAIAAFLALGLALQNAEAGRLGGGRSLGAQRYSVVPNRSVRPAPAPAAPAAAPQPGNRWFGPMAGLAAGLGLGWLLSEGGLGGTLGILLMLALAGYALVLLARLFARRKSEADTRENGLRYARAESAPAPIASPLPASAPAFGAAPAAPREAQANIPAGFDTAGFLREAKLNFIRLQAAHDSANLEALREFTTDEMFASLSEDLRERGALGQQTDVVTLNADLLEAQTEGDSHWASVRFSGMIREDAASRPESFEEIWNLAKPVSGATGWVLAGIQQMQ